MGYTHYYYTKFDKFGELDENKQPKSDEFWKLWDKFCDVVYKVCEKSKERGIALGNGMGEYYPVIYGPEILFTGSVKQPLGKWVRTPGIQDNEQSEKFGQMLAEHFEPVKYYFQQVDYNGQVIRCLIKIQKEKLLVNGLLE